MNNIFGTLISRHKTSLSKDTSAGSYASSMVEPRPKAHFEVDNEVGRQTEHHVGRNDGDRARAHIPQQKIPNEALLNQNPSMLASANAKSALLSHSKPTTQLLHAQNPTIPTQSNTQHTIVNKLSAQMELNNVLNESDSVKNSTSLLPSTDIVNRSSEYSDNTTNNMNDDSTTQSRLTDELERKSSLLLSGDLEAQLASISKGLKPSDLSHKNATNNLPTNKDGSLSTNAGNAQQSKQPHSNKDNTQALLANLEARQSTQNTRDELSKVNAQGLLTTPLWVASMQSNINQRWQQLNAKIESTNAVVNVTIGRVEVRAVQGCGSQMPNMQKSTQKKPSGVMSLHDYLKSRDKGEQA